MKIAAIIIILASVQLNAQQFEMKGMQIQTEVISTDQLKISGWAETKGWVAIGFNTHAGIIGADLKMLALTNDGPQLDDRKTIAFGDYPSDTSVGGQMNINLIELKQLHNKTHFTLTIPRHSKDPNDHQLDQETPLWIIMAYSAETDFNHHSRQRQHFKFN